MLHQLKTKSGKESPNRLVFVPGFLPFGWHHLTCEARDKSVVSDIHLCILILFSYHCHIVVMSSQSWFYRQNTISLKTLSTYSASVFCLFSSFFVFLSLSGKPNVNSYNFVDTFFPLILPSSHNPDRDPDTTPPSLFWTNFLCLLKNTTTLGFDVAPV